MNDRTTWRVFSHALGDSGYVLVMVFTDAPTVADEVDCRQTGILAENQGVRGGVGKEDNSMVSGINHITLAVSDLERSFRFYTRVVGLKPVAKWSGGAYLLAGEGWVCLSLDAGKRSDPEPEYTHIAFSVENGSFNESAEAIRAHNVTIWKENQSEGDSLYFLDPDGHKLELHAGDLQTRLAALRKQPYEGLELYV